MKKQILSKVFLTGQLVDTPTATPVGRQPAWTILEVAADHVLSSDRRVEACGAPFEVHLWGKHARLAGPLAAGARVLVEGWIELPAEGELPSGPAVVAGEYLSVATPDDRYVYSAA